MQKELLIQKWLDGELTTAERAEFEKLPEYASYEKLSQGAMLFKDTSYDVDLEFDKLNTILKDRKKTSDNIRWLKPLLRIAAIFIIGLAVYFMPIYTKDITVNALASNTTAVQLPDKSNVKLNAGSSLRYKKKSWNSNREVNLVGEAYFEVSKGSRFDVVTWAGTVSVLGTHFDVKQRSNLFEVTCYEGLVSVTYKDQDYKVPAGNSFQVIDGKVTESKISETAPTWVNKNMSSFKSTPYNEVLKEFERQYNVKIQTENVDTLQLFTGSFSNSDKEIALKSITLPLQLKYVKQNNSEITLTKE
ncbi:MAG: FecR family protein [Flavobacteriaceae bacterium]|nr:FecR family protein [Flavobacteriaceae bacterium]